MYQQQQNVAMKQELHNAELQHCQKAANMEQKRYEVELERQAQITLEEKAMDERRIQEKQNNLNDLYGDYNAQLAEQHEGDQERNKQQCDGNDKDENKDEDEDEDEDEIPSPSWTHAQPHIYAQPQPSPSLSPPPLPPPDLSKCVPPSLRPYQEPVIPNYLGPMNVESSNCHTLHFDSEKLRKSTWQQAVFEICCSEGLVHLPPLPAWLVNLHHLYENNANFQKQI